MLRWNLGSAGGSHLCSTFATGRLRALVSDGAGVSNWANWAINSMAWCVQDAILGNSDGVPCRGGGVRGMGRPSHTKLHPWGTWWMEGQVSPGIVRQCANLTFGFMTLFLCSKCHGKCQAKAEAG